MAPLQRLLPLRSLFSTTSGRFDDASQELSAKLDNEIALEGENTESQADSDSNVKGFLEQNDFWTLNAPEGEQEVTLTRQYDDETITVHFSIADYSTGSVLGEEESDEAYLDEEEDLGTGQSGGANTKGAINQGRTSGGNIKVAPEDSIAPSDREELRNEEVRHGTRSREVSNTTNVTIQDDYEGQQAFPANVNVLIQRSGRGALRINLVTDNGRFTIHGVTQLPESTSSDPKELLRSTPETLYTGPPFQQLDEEVQGLLEQYLDVRGINTALALFVPDYIDVKEQKEYLGWLKRVKNFIE